MAAVETAAPYPAGLGGGLAASILSGFGTDGRPLEVRPCKYYPNCAKMDDPEHNAMYSHNSVVKRVPKEKRDPSKPADPQGTQLCGFGDQCKRCGDEDHLDKFLHACKFGNKCKKMDDPIHLKRFIHVLPPGFPTGPTIPTRRGQGGGGFPAFPYGMPPAFPPSYGAYYGAMANPFAGPYAAAAAAGTSSPHATHHARSSAGYHPYGRSGASAGANAASLYGAAAADPLAAASGYGASGYGAADRAAAAAAANASAYSGYANYGNYSDAAHLMQNQAASQYGV